MEYNICRCVLTCYYVGLKWRFESICKNNINVDSRNNLIKNILLIFKEVDTVRLIAYII